MKTHLPCSHAHELWRLERDAATFGQLRVVHVKQVLGGHSIKRITELETRFVEQHFDADQHGPVVVKMLAETRALVLVLKKHNTLFFEGEEHGVG